MTEQPDQAKDPEAQDTPEAQPEPSAASAEGREARGDWGEHVSDDPFDAETGTEGGAHKGEPSAEDVDEDPTESAAGGDDSPDAAPATETTDDDDPDA